MAEKQRITVSQILKDLENGLARVAIAEKYGLTTREVKTMFEHPKLQGKQAKKKFVPTFDLVDDTDDAPTGGIDETDSAEMSEEADSVFR